MTTDPNGWPDASKPGVPLHPERNGWHWLHHPEDIRPIVQPWDAEHASWISGAMHSPQGVADLGFRYLGPCLLPDALARALDQARREGMEAAARIAQSVRVPFRDHDPAKYEIGVEIAAAIRAAMEKEGGDE
jgi:hypothetical protein